MFLLLLNEKQFDKKKFPILNKLLLNIFKNNLQLILDFKTILLFAILEIVYVF